jgi:beta-galactosidase
VLQRWLEWGIDRMERGAMEVTIAGGAIRRRSVWRLPGCEQTVTQEERFSLQQDAAGALRIEQRLAIPRRLDDLPRVGLRVLLAPDLDRLEYYGRGPGENHSDRLRGYPLARYRSTAAAEHVPYVVPQACGNHTEVRWLAVTDGGGRGLQVAFDQPGEFSLNPYGDAALFKARHTKDLAPDDVLHLHLDHRQRGVGTGACGPDTLPQYRVGGGHHRFAVTVMPLR